jgi:lysophospholipase L1-like esterase
VIRHRFCRCFVPLLLLVLCLPSPASADLQFPLKAKRILFLGDSITHAGRYVVWIETQFRLQGVSPLPEIVNIGLSSETCSGLSEPDHPFPRPDVHERLDRALAKVKPDVVVACYGMNDGIYHPFSEDRLRAYQNGVNRLIKKVHAAGAKLVLMTPPPFDPLPLRGKAKLKPAGEKKYAYFAIYENYDDVLARYAKWVMQQSDRVEMVIDLHTPLVEYVAEKRKKHPQFTLSPDGIHPNAAGHRLLGGIILRAWGIESTTEPDVRLLKLMTQRMSLLHDAWLSEVGHKRPGVKPGLPLAAASAKAKQLEALIKPLVTKAQQPATSSLPSTGGTIDQLHYPAMAKPNELRFSVDYTRWMPVGVTRLRAVIVHQTSAGGPGQRPLANLRGKSKWFLCGDVSRSTGSCNTQRASVTYRTAARRAGQFFNLGDVCSVISDVLWRAEGVNPRVFPNTGRLTPAARHSYFETLTSPAPVRKALVADVRRRYPNSILQHFNCIIDRCFYLRSANRNGETTKPIHVPRPASGSD